MENFKWCIWLIPEKDHHWNSITNGFPVHLTLASHLEEDDAWFLYKHVTFDPVYINLVGKPILDIKDNFQALYYEIEPKLDWFPDNPHVSFRYSYDSLDQDLPEIKGGAWFKYLAMVDCSGHFKEWTLTS